MIHVVFTGTTRDRDGEKRRYAFFGVVSPQASGSRLWGCGLADLRSDSFYHIVASESKLVRPDSLDSWQRTRGHWRCPITPDNLCAAG